MATEIPIPIACGVVGAIVGVIAGGCGSQTLPIIIGSSLGGGLGTLVSLLNCISNNYSETPEPSIKKEPEKIINNPAINGSPKDEDPTNI
jgi:hypothetical protein